MVEEVLALCRGLGAEEGQEALLRPRAQAAVEMLAGRLRRGTAPEDCGPAFPMAAAMTAMEQLSAATGEDRVVSFSAGDVSVRTRGGAPAGLAAQALRLLAPWLAETGFAFRGVDG